VGFRPVPKSVTLNDLERRKIWSLFCLIWVAFVTNYVKGWLAINRFSPEKCCNDTNYAQWTCCALHGSRAFCCFSCDSSEWLVLVWFNSFDWSFQLITHWHSETTYHSPKCKVYTSETKLDKKLIRRWDSERELSLSRHHTRTTKYNRLVHNFRFRQRWTWLCVASWNAGLPNSVKQSNCSSLGHSRSLILVPIKIWKLIYDFLLVINTNLPPILHRFQVMADYWSHFR